MKYLIIYLIILSAFPTCCNNESVEIGRVSLSENEIELIPYTKNQNLNFKHSNGFKVSFVVTQDTYNWSSDNYFDDCDVGEYTSYQERFVFLESEYPEFKISLSLSNMPNFNEESKNMQITINRYNSNLNYTTDFEFICENATCYEEVVADGKRYFNVIESDLKNSSGTNGILTLYPQKLLYNKKNGIIQIKMSNNETYTLSN